MIFKSIWKVSAELSVLNIFKLFRILLEYTRYERAEITSELPTCRQKSVDPFFIKTLHTFRRERNTSVGLSVVFIVVKRTRTLRGGGGGGGQCLSSLALGFSAFASPSSTCASSFFSHRYRSGGNLVGVLSKKKRIGTTVE